MATTTRIEQSFYEQPGGFFGTKSAPGYPSPVKVITDVALDRVSDKEALQQLPHGLNLALMAFRINAHQGYEDHVHITPSQAQGLRLLGQHILELNQAEGINPPLTLKENRLIGHLVSVVPATAGVEQRQAEA